MIEASVAGSKLHGGGKKGKLRLDYDKTDHLMEKEGYCWSCGFRVPKNHNSMNCDKQKPGHQLGATRVTQWVAVASITGGNPNDDTNQ
eukprot:890792-Ditylum_brightwellii.AAC.1